MNIHELLAELEKAESAVLAELKRLYPVGTKIGYRLHGGKDAHRYPVQEGEVVGHIGGGEARLRVKLARSRNARLMDRDDCYVTSIPLQKIIDTRSSGDGGG